ncbi:hypothetical protein P167DRAFT_531298 [Morchella conica CCBAS932]|uniref:Uncharacterized protein n=1 Tax=Morchella conica CCBAS932 TaxID=1392247 RepID=A0A3N4L4D9_9PEZI|nr:hypothetical protein P167DRAFT_531298 [Morchella conica CCBAS932]
MCDRRILELFNIHSVLRISPGCGSYTRNLRTIFDVLVRSVCSLAIPVSLCIFVL